MVRRGTSGRLGERRWGWWGGAAAQRRPGNGETPTAARGPPTGGGAPDIERHTRGDDLGAPHRPRHAETALDIAPSPPPPPTPQRIRAHTVPETTPRTHPWGARSLQHPRHNARGSCGGVWWQAGLRKTSCPAGVQGLWCPTKKQHPRCRGQARRSPVVLSGRATIGMAKCQSIPDRKSRAQTHENGSRGTPILAPCDTWFLSCQLAAKRRQSTGPAHQRSKSSDGSTNGSRSTSCSGLRPERAVAAPRPGSRNTTLTLPCHG